MSQLRSRNLALVVLGALVFTVAAVQAGCPFDNESCQQDCLQQGCQVGYCGHFAWSQCICRKCGDDWNHYDKVRYRPGQTVNQTELDSLKLNSSRPLILTNSDERPVAQSASSNAAANNKTQTAGARPKQAASTPAPPPAPTKQTTLTTLLIPDLSETGKLDLNDIPDENSEKFLDFLAKNHEKLVQATSARQQQQPTTTTLAPPNGGEAEMGAEESSTDDPEALEIQISSQRGPSPIWTPSPASMAAAT